MKPAAILFDLDGTLLDTLDDLADSMNAALAAMGFPGHPVASFRQFIGDGVETLVRRALPADRREEQTVHACVVGMRAHYAEHWADKTRPYPGIPELLDRLRQRQLKMAVLSNKPDVFTKLMIRHFFPGHWAGPVLGASPEHPRKPDPAAALHISRELGCRPEEILFLGDSAPDMQTARAAGMFPVGALWGFRTREELLENGAAALVAHPRDILPLL